MPDPSPEEPLSRLRPSSPSQRSIAATRRLDVLASAQTIGALALGILLFVVPLYLWRRPRSSQVPPRVDAALPDAAHDSAVAVAEARDAAPLLPVRLADPHVLECHDKGARRTPSEQCDHVVAFEKALADAILASHECVPADAGAGSIEFVADLSFARHHNPVTVALPRGGRTFQSSKIVHDCTVGVRSRLSSLPVSQFTHAHARYKFSVVANYAGTHSS